MAIQLTKPADLARRLEQGEAVTFIDVRSPAEYRGGHAKGAVSVPLDSIDPSSFVNRQPVFVICQSGARAKRACEQLAAAGVESVYSVEGGTSAWVTAGLPVEQEGRRHVSIERQVRIAAGGLVLIGSIAAYEVHPAFLLLTAFIGAGLVFAGITNTCGMAAVLARMPWNR